MPWTKEDRSFKILVNKRVTDSNKAYYEEFGADSLDIHLREIKVDDIYILSASTAVTERNDLITQNKIELLSAFTLTEDVTVSNGAAWRALSGSTPITNWVSPKYNAPDELPTAGYFTKLYDNNDVQIFPTDASDWFFDYTTGVLTFGGSTTAFAEPYKITAYRYIGETADEGYGGGGRLTYQDISAQTTTLDGDLLSNEPLGDAPNGHVILTVNGNQVRTGYTGGPIVGNPIDAVFVNSANTIVRQNDQIQIGDKIRWYGGNAGYQISPNDEIRVTFLT
jgi:hypothetical protein